MEERPSSHIAEMYQMTLFLSLTHKHSAQQEHEEEEEDEIEKCSNTFPHTPPLFFFGIARAFKTIISLKFKEQILIPTEIYKSTRELETSRTLHGVMRSFLSRRIS